MSDKDRFGIEMIILADNSLKKCHNENIQLGNMLTLLTGETWQKTKFYFVF
jgi:hypothetical protein